LAGRLVHDHASSFTAVDNLVNNRLRIVSPQSIGDHVSELPFVEDQHPVQAFSADRADPPLGVGVGPRRTRRTTQHRNADTGEHGIEAGGEPS
jgi:hypothetical protein